MHRSRVTIMLACALSAAAVAGPSLAATVAGGGSTKTDCVAVLEIPSANSPAPPRAPKGVDCIDGDPTCDSDGLRNGECVFELQLCINSTALTTCTPETAQNLVVDHAIDDGSDRRFDTDFQALQSRANGLGLPAANLNRCTLSSAITVRLRGPNSLDKMKLNRKSLRVTTNGTTVAGPARDVDKVKFTCRPEGDAIYLPINLYTGTYDRINRQIFTQSCALSGCHDSENHEGNLILLSGASYSNLVNVTADDTEAASDMLKRVTPGDPSMSFLYLKITDDLLPTYGDSMPKGKPALNAELIELVRLWIIGDGILGEAPQTGWVVGTDQ
jgi:hypothetical protein